MNLYFLSEKYPAKEMNPNKRCTITRMNKLNPWTVMNVQRIVKFSCNKANDFVKLATVNSLFREVMVDFETPLLMLRQNRSFWTDTPTNSIYRTTSACVIAVRPIVWFVEQIVQDKELFKKKHVEFFYYSGSSLRIIDLLLSSFSRHISRKELGRDFLMKTRRLMSVYVLGNFISMGRFLAIDIVLRHLIENQIYTPDEIMTLLAPSIPSIQEGLGRYQLAQECIGDPKDRALTLKVVMDHVKSFGKKAYIDEILFHFEVTRGKTILAQAAENDLFIKDFMFLVSYCSSSDHFFDQASVASGFMDISLLQHIQKRGSAQLKKMIKNRSTFFARCVKFVNDQVLPLYRLEFGLTTRRRGRE